MKKRGSILDKFELSDYGKHIPPVKDDEFYRFACAYYLHQDSLSWSRTQILFAVEGAALAAALSQRTSIAVLALLSGSVLVFLIWRLVQRDWQVRDQYLNFLDKFHKFTEDSKIKMTVDPKGYSYRGSSITQFIILALIAINFLWATVLLWPHIAGHH
jgi:hypothetical protein